MTAPTCPTCREYEDAIRYQAQRDYRAKMELWRKYLNHQTTDHCLHVAYPKENQHETRSTGITQRT